MALRFGNYPTESPLLAMQRRHQMQESAQDIGGALGMAIKGIADKGGVGKAGKAFRKYLSGPFKEGEIPKTFEQWKAQEWDKDPSNPKILKKKKTSRAKEFQSLVDENPEAYKQWKSDTRKWEKSQNPPWWEFGARANVKSQTPRPGSFKDYLKSQQSDVDQSIQSDLEMESPDEKRSLFQRWKDKLAQKKQLRLDRKKLKQDLNQPTQFDDIGAEYSVDDVQQFKQSKPRPLRMTSFGGPEIQDYNYMLNTPFANKVNIDDPALKFKTGGILGRIFTPQKFKISQQLNEGLLGDDPFSTYEQMLSMDPTQNPGLDYQSRYETSFSPQQREFFEQYGGMRGPLSNVINNRRY
tara:strand:+ start:462 stop:1517 length:1056 start_codon:yes stop_codon:yes gene_type:complete